MCRGCTFVLSLARAEDVFRLLLAGCSAFFWKRAYHGRCIAGSCTPPKHLENSGCEAEERILAKRRCLFAAGFRLAPCCQLLRHFDCACHCTFRSVIICAFGYLWAVLAQKRQETHGDTYCCDGLVRCQLVDIRSTPSCWPTMCFWVQGCASPIAHPAMCLKRKMQRELIQCSAKVIAAIWGPLSAVMFAGCTAEMFHRVRSDGVEWLLEPQGHRENNQRHAATQLISCVWGTNVRCVQDAHLRDILRLCEKSGSPASGCFPSGTDFSTSAAG